MILSAFNGDFLEADLENLRHCASTAGDVDLIDAFLDQVAANEDLLWKISKWENTNQSPHFNCKAIVCFQNEGYNIYRIRPLGKRLSKYRILYAYDAPYNELHFLAIVLKRQEQTTPNDPLTFFYNYEYEHPISKRIRDEYDNSNFTKTKR